MQESTLDIHYIGSYKSVSVCPALKEPEYCFIGRSNVGKSSIINYITGVDEIARTSKKPGKTQSINLFKVEEESPWMIADLPGYGFAQVSKSTRGEWSALIDGYVMGRENLVCTFLLIDVRHKRLENDREFMNYLGEKSIPFCILFTKSDKLKPMELQNALAAYEDAMLTEWETMPPKIVTSSMKDVGRQEILDYIHHLNDIFAKL
ncbi:MAG: ribosome biogenesis GTP-binding protein YihA/YsxC [Bacteroidota bacterium]|nr:ribosome biogenesis GTP-binding protein YihA/YsxC [Bacteroidota bacterium]